ncbi:MAG TPA: acetyl-CoA carboxylase biotin carboxyl carrier protein, partial [Gemmataceae bacterium]|nr:acetyl-CoA carboxylase biotin carboxyl carrier protein [Gemmataceae bacterium]
TARQLGGSAVADDATNRPGPFDVQTVRQLVALMSRHDLSEIELSEGERRIRLRRGPRKIAVAPQALAAAAAPAPARAAAAEAAPPEDAAKPRKAATPLVEIKAPTVGTFYAAPNPDAPPFVQVGSRVTPTTVVGLIEAMKLFNEIPAECSGVIVEVLVQNQQPVEFGQVLFRVDPTA